MQRSERVYELVLNVCMIGSVNDWIIVLRIYSKAFEGSIMSWDRVFLFASGIVLAFHGCFRDFCWEGVFRDGRRHSFVFAFKIAIRHSISGLMKHNMLLFT